MKKNPFYGLVLIGGKSSRMKMDKYDLEYHGKMQFMHSYEMLKPFCDEVFISSRLDQTDDTKLKNYPQIFDLDPFEGIGPMGGILSAMTQHPEATWLVLACDLPYLTENHLKTLMDKRNKKKLATAYISKTDDLPEPLCTIYETNSLDYLIQYFKNGKNCPRKFLMKHNVELINQLDKMGLLNVNVPEDYRKAKSYFSKYQ